MSSVIVNLKQDSFWWGITQILQHYQLQIQIFSDGGGQPAEGGGTPTESNFFLKNHVVSGKQLVK